MPHPPKTKAVAINVGVNNNAEWGGFRAPIFSDGRFHFIHIPWKDPYGKIEPAPNSYIEMNYAGFVAPRWKNKQVFVSPDFKNKTYASANSGQLSPADKPIRMLVSNDFLFFYATLDFIGDAAKKKEWINASWVHI